MLIKNSNILKVDFTYWLYDFLITFHVFIFHAFKIITSIITASSSNKEEEKLLIYFPHELER